MSMPTGDPPAEGATSISLDSQHSGCRPVALVQLCATVESASSGEQKKPGEATDALESMSLAIRWQDFSAERCGFSQGIPRGSIQDRATSTLR